MWRPGQGRPRIPMRQTAEDVREHKERQMFLRVLRKHSHKVDAHIKMIRKHSTEAQRLRAIGTMSSQCDAEASEKAARRDFEDLVQWLCHGTGKSVEYTVTEMAAMFPNDIRLVGGGRAEVLARATSPPRMEPILTPVHQPDSFRSALHRARGFDPDNVANCAFDEYEHAPVQSQHWQGMHNAQPRGVQSRGTDAVEMPPEVIEQEPEASRAATREATPMNQELPVEMLGSETGERIQGLVPKERLDLNDSSQRWDLIHSVGEEVLLPVRRYDEELDTSAAGPGNYLVRIAKKRALSCPPMMQPLPVVATHPGISVGDTTLFNPYGSKTSKKQNLLHRNQRIRARARVCNFIEQARSEHLETRLRKTGYTHMIPAPNPPHSDETMRFFQGTCVRGTPNGGVQRNICWDKISTRYIDQPRS